jgi:N-acylneuraminate cytidylyltransferase
MNIVTIIPARGGSKGIIKKNIIEIKGKPLLYYSVNASLNSNVNSTYVCTDDNEIRDEAVKLGSKVLMRPSYLADDVIMPDPTLLYFASVVEFDVLVFIQPTSPLIKKEYINEGIEMIKSGNYDSVFTVTEEHWLPRWNDKIKPVEWDIENRPRRQDMPLNFIENGMMYITKRETLLKTKLRYGGTMGFVKIPLKQSFQLDSNEDLDLIRKIL